MDHSYYETISYPWLIHATYFSGKSVSMQCSSYFGKRSMLYNTYAVLGVTASGWECNSTQRRCLILSRLISSGREIAVAMKWSSIEWIRAILGFFLVRHRDLVSTFANRSRKHHRVHHLYHLNIQLHVEGNFTQDNMVIKPTLPRNAQEDVPKLSGSIISWTAHWYTYYGTRLNSLVRLRSRNYNHFLFHTA